MLLGRALVFAGAIDLFLVRIEASILGKNPPLLFARLWVRGFWESLFLGPGKGTDFEIDVGFDRESREDVRPCNLAIVCFLCSLVIFCCLNFYENLRGHLPLATVGFFVGWWYSAG